MKAFEWTTAGSIEEAVKLLDTGKDVRSAPLDPTTKPSALDYADLPRPLSGGQDLLTTMKERITRPSRVVNLKTIPGLDKIEGNAATGLKIGALATLTDIHEHPEIIKSFPGLSEAAASIATPQIRNLGTIGGNLCQRPRCWYFRLENVICLKKGGDTCYAASGENKYHAIFAGGPSFIVHPSDLAPMLIALGASITIAGPDGKRDMALADFFALPDVNVRKENILKDAEIVTQITVPPSAFASRSTYLKFKERSSLDFALASCAAAVDIGPGNVVRQARIVLGGVAPIPWHVPKAEAALIGKTLDEKTIADVATIALAGATPLEKNEYKVPLAQALVRRALKKLGAA